MNLFLALAILASTVTTLTSSIAVAEGWPWQNNEGKVQVVRKPIAGNRKSAAKHPRHIEVKTTKKRKAPKRYLAVPTEQDYLGGAGMSREDRLQRKTKYIAALNGAFMAGFMAQLPASATHWNPTQEKNALKQWEDNVTKIPHFDQDSWHWNYVAHPIAGSWYYNVCRSENFSVAECYTYSFLVSAVVWEYGIEATKERPSIQDLIITPTAGMILGEISHQLLLEIRQNDGEVMGSKKLGKAVSILLDPFTEASNGLEYLLKPISKKLKPKVFLTYGAVSPSPYLSNWEREQATGDRAVTLGVEIPLPIGWDTDLVNYFKTKK